MINTFVTAKTAELTIEGHPSNLPLLAGTEGERAIDIRNLRKETGHITLDSGYMNTGSCTSTITFINGEQGILRYRGIPIEQLAEKSTFVEVCYLLIYGQLPNKQALSKFSNSLTEHALIHEDMKNFFQNFSSQAHPMATLSAMVTSLPAD